MNTDSELVTFRKEGVDWNKNLSLVSRSFLGHLPQGRCGLKCDSIVLSHPGIMSPSARKVWIEIPLSKAHSTYVAVTFRKEGVDWNSRLVATWECAITSPSARKVWIEIVWFHWDYGQNYRHLPQGRCGLKYNTFLVSCANKVVTFRKEGVDWNYRCRHIVIH